MSCKDGQFTFIRTVFGSGSTRVSHNSDDVSSSQVLMLCFETDISVGFLRLTHYLNLGPATSDVIEDQLRSRRSLDVDSAGDSNLHLLHLFTGLEMGVLLNELAEICVDLELMRVGIGILGLSQAIDSSTSDFKVLLQSSQ